MGSKCDEDGTRDPLGVTRAPASFAHCDQGSTRFFARGMIARVVRLPAFVSGLKMNWHNGFAAAAQRAIRPPGGCRALRS